jgi:ribosomal protein L33, bacterial type
MAKRGNRVQVILECTEQKGTGVPGMSRYITTKIRKIRQKELNLRSSTPTCVR